MKRHTLPRFFRLLGLTGLCLGLAAGHLAAQCTGEVLNVSAPTHNTSGTLANWTAPPTGGPYKVKITAKGAKGGSGSGSGPGAGASMVGEFIVASGQTLQSIAGAPGQNSTGIIAAGGGGAGSGAQIQGGSLLILAGGGGGGGYFFTGLSGSIVAGNGSGGPSGGGPSDGAGGGGILGAGANGGTNGIGSAPTGGGAGFGAMGGTGRNSGSVVGGNGGGGFSGGGNSAYGGGGGGYSGGTGGADISNIYAAGGGGSYNVGTNQSNTAGSNNAGGQVIIECLGAAVLTATATPTQPVCATPTQGSVSIDLTGDLNGYTSGGLEYAVASGGTFSGSPTFSGVTADPFSITSGTGTVADADGETYTVRVRVKYNPAVFVDVTYTLTSPASTRTWTGTVSTDWNTDGNWNPTCVPTAADDVVIPNVANDPVLSTAAAAKTVWVQSSSLLTINAGASLTVNGSFTTGGFITQSMLNHGTVENNGTITIGSTTPCGQTAIENSGGGTFNNNSTGQIYLDRSQSGGVGNRENSTFNNAGYIEIGGMASVGTDGITNQGTFTNAITGQVIVNNATSYGIQNFFATVFNNFGSITIGSAGNVGGTGITNNSSPFNNSGCSALIKIFSNSTIVNTGNPAPENFTNSGIIIENASGTSNITSNSGIVQNLNGGTFTITTNTGTLTTATGDIWTGCTSTDWHTASNWLDGSVPTASDDVIIGNVANDPVLSTAATAKSVHVQSGAQLSISAAGNLEVNGFFSWLYGQTIGFLNEGTVSNDGTLNIGNISSVGTYGVVNYGTFSNNASGQIFINRSSDDGFASYSNTINAGYLELGGSQSVGNNGIFLQNAFTNAAGGQISIDRASQRAINLFGSGTNFTNFGSITIGASGNVGQYAIHRGNSTFNNSGCSARINILSNSIINGAGGFNNSGIIIENASGTSGIATNSGIVQNLNGGTFTIGSGNPAITATGDIWTGCTSTDWHTASNWLDGSVPTATDNVLIPNVASDPVIGAAAVAKSVTVESSAAMTVAAAGTLTIDGSADQGILNQGTVENNGTITIGATVGVGSYGIDNQATFNNVGGEISIDRSSQQGLRNSSGTFTNAAKITIGSVAEVGSEGFHNAATFYNNAGGEISMDRSSGYGLKNFSGTFINAAKITIGALANIGSQGIDNAATFQNNASGEISIDNSYNSGIKNSNDFINAGKITLGALANIGGVGIENSATFDNNAGGEISIDRQDLQGLFNGSGTFTNSAKITIGATNAGNYSLWNQATFHNNACAELVSFAAVFNGSSNTITNAGLFTVNTTGAHTNNGTLTNNGIITYPQGNPIPNVTNNDVVVQSVSGGCTDVNNALQLGGAVSCTAGTTWYLDESLTQSGGTYNQATNTFTPTSLPVNTPTTLYFSVTDGANACARTVSVQVTLVDVTAPSITCPTGEVTQTFSYTGAVQTFTVPPNITRIEIEAYGAQGAGSYAYPSLLLVEDGGLGGFAKGTLSVTPGEVLHVYVGEKPNTSSSSGQVAPGGWNGGGKGGYFGGGGGGASDVRQGGTNLTNRRIVAGGGGGGNEGDPNHGAGGPGGGLNGGDGIGFYYPVGRGGGQTSGGVAGNNSVAGSFGQGGDGKSSATIFYHGGGGGGGWYGGGGAFAAGGGGGSSYIGGVANGMTTAGVNNGHGSVVIKYNPTLVFADENCQAVVGTRMPSSLSDNCGAPTVVQSPASGTILSGHNDMETVVLTATDGAGNTETCSFTVTLKDATAPTVVCKPATVNLNSGGTATLVAINTVEVFNLVASSDNCSFVNVQSVSPDVFGCGNLGVNTVTLTATDAAGNAGSCTATVTIQDATPPGIVCPDPVVVGTSGGVCGGTATWAVPVPTDNCGGAVIQSASHLPGAAFGGGSTTVTYVASDAAGNTSSCAFAVTVVDDDPPVAACKSASVTLNASGTATLAAAAVNDGSSDNCTASGGLSLSVSPNTFGCADSGPSTVTLTVTDGTGHSGQCTAVVTVVDALHFTQAAAPVATDGLAGDRLGHGVGLWGGVLVAGAPDDKVGTQSKQGSAYVFLQNQGGTGNWGQLKQVKASDGAAVDYFGNAVSVDGSLALVGAHGDNVGAATDAGSAYIYEQDHLGPDNWGQRAKFGAVNGGTPEPAAYDYYGNAVSLRGSRAVVGAAKKQVGPNAAQGAVYVHEKDAGGPNNWGHVKKLVATDGGANNFFGQSVSQWGDVVLVGASGHLSNRGASYLFGKDTGGAGNWGQAQKLTASDAAVGDGFGTSVSLTSGWAVIGAPNKGVYAGAAYIFKNDAGTWSQVKKLTASDGAPGDRFGTSVWLEGDHAYVSAVQSGGAGAVYVYHRDAGGAGNWGEVGKYQPSGGGAGERFGHALAASGDRLALGAPLSDVSGRVDQGRAYVLDGDDCGGLPRLQPGEQQTATAAKRPPARGLALWAYPNPFADELTVEMAVEAQAVAGTRVVLADATGRPVAEAEFAAGQAFAVLRTGALQPGMYFVQARTKAGLQVVPVALVR